ncbi:MAG: ion transporter [Minwuia sp.]|uniref:ion transporter n=1 Tax=Minwuia sp. TaxID=2493630 RepID=UPI003A8415DA
MNPISQTGEDTNWLTRTRGRVRTLVENPTFERAILVIICLNAVTLGLETSPSAMAAAGPLILFLDGAALTVFVVEIALKLFAYGRGFFRNGWNLFDLAVVGIALVPSEGGLSVLRALRILRALRLVSGIPSMRKVVQGLFKAIPGMGSIIALLVLVFYICAVIATKLFKNDFPEWFGDLGASAYSLFQIMTLESWSMGIVRPVMEQYPYAWIFFVTFILLTSFTVLNLFIAVIVNAMQSQHEAELREAESTAHDERVRMLEELVALRQDVARLAERLPAPGGGEGESAKPG